MQTSKSYTAPFLSNAIAYLCLAGMILYTYSLYRASALGITIILLILIVMALFATTSPEPDKRAYSRIVLGVESLLGFTMLLLADGEAPYPMIYFMLSAQAVSISPKNYGFIWIGSFSVLTAIAFLVTYPTFSWFIDLMIFSGGYMFFGVFALAFIQADSARRETQEALARLEEAHRLLREQSVRDPLTDLFNRRYLEETLERENARSNRQEESLSLIMIDIDHFKRLNDTYGHLAGDKVLKEMGAILRTGCRTEDIPCRYGGEEMMIVLPGMRQEGAIERAELWRQKVEQMRVPWENVELQVTVSLGVATYPQHATNGKALIECADQALYHAKNSGRNRVSVYVPESLS